MKKFDVVIIGAGAAGMMCAIEAGKRGRHVLVVEHNKSVGEKIRISGGGRCNFTQIEASYKNYLSANPKFSISALSRFSPQDFIALVDAHQIAWHQKAAGQLFCDGPATQIIEMLTKEMARLKVEVWTGTEVRALGQSGEGFLVSFSSQSVSCASLVVACGGKSIPKMGGSGFGYKIAEQFGLRVTEIRPGLVPLTFDPTFLEKSGALAGVSVEAVAMCGKTSFREALLFTHRGLSGPVILQISSFWREGKEITINLAPDVDVLAALKQARDENGRQEVVTALGHILPKRLAGQIAGEEHKRLADIGNKALVALAERINNWRIKPTGTEGYRTAEVTLGGVDTRDLNAGTLEAKSVPGLYFIGEIVDVTGWLGGYNFQWAWSSGWAAGQVV
jgi:predicted Rossmann fold flavoprotein